MWSPRTCLYLFRMPMLGSKNGLFQTLDSIKDFLFRLLSFRSHMPPSNNLNTHIIFQHTFLSQAILMSARTQSYLDGARLEHRAACRRMLVSSQLRYALEYFQTCLFPTLTRSRLSSRLRTSACITPLNVVSG